MDWLARLFESKEDKQARMFEQFSQSEEFKDMLSAKAEEVVKKARDDDEKERVEKEAADRQRLADAEKNIEVLSDAMRESSVPHVIIRSLNFSPENGIEVKLDYNAAFIKYLTASGIKGANEDQIIKTWLAFISQEVFDEELSQDYLMNGVSDDEMPSINYEKIMEALDEDEDDDDWDEDQRNN